MVALRKPTEPARSRRPERREIYRERCRDEYGNHYVVIVWRDWPGLPTTSYSLRDGTPVQYEDECFFRLPNGRLISRCED
jgi:hypothetical protein